VKDQVACGTFDTSGTGGRKMRGNSILVCAGLIFALAFFSLACSSKKSSGPSLFIPPISSYDNTFQCETGLNASGWIEGATKTDGEIIQHNEPKYGFVKIDISSVPVSYVASSARLYFNVVFAGAAQGGMYISHTDPQSGAMDLYTGAFLLAQPKHAVGSRSLAIPSSGITQLNTAIAAGQGYVTFLWYAC